MPGAYISSTLYINGRKAIDISEVTPAPMKYEEKDYETIEATVYAFNYNKFQAPRGTVKFNSPPDAVTYGLLFDPANKIEFSVNALYHQHDPVTQQFAKLGNIMIFRVMAGGVATETMSTEGGMLEWAYAAVSCTIQDKNGIEVMYVNFSNNEMRINGVDVRAEDKQILGT